ncbi:TetR/AcrR family transcriptional regulator [Streptomyces flavidovirens]|uniref:TetR/AcrR family transcriptional regulator n=1 Tax=Streptomyces flavidovirens TaxID=67298 RepID=UPI001FCBD840|nr:TetR/AcrR family transcriptional regulator [Streptomyces flavidovirens]
MYESRTGQPGGTRPVGPVPAKPNAARRPAAPCWSPPPGACPGTATATSCWSRWPATPGTPRGALYHQFKGKQDLTLAALQWILDTWQQEVGRLVSQESEPVAALLAMARGHAVFCRRDFARMAIALRLEFTGQAHPVGREVERSYDELVAHCVQLIDAGRAAGTIPSGPPTRTLALAFVGALEGTVVALAGQAPHDELLAERAVAGVLGLDPAAPGRKEDH